MAGVGTPSAVTILKNGRLQITWSGASSITSVPNNYTNNKLNLQYGFPGGSTIAPVSATVENRGKVVGSNQQGEPGTRHSFATNVQKSEISVVARAAFTGSTIAFSTPNNGGGIFGTAGACVVFGTNWNTQWTVTPLTVTLTNNYVGPTTDIRLNDVADTVDAYPVVNTDSGSGSTTVISFQFSGGRSVRLKAGRTIGEVTVRVAGGSPISASAWNLVGSDAKTVEITFPVNVLQGETVRLTIPDSVFELGQLQSNGSFTNPLNCVDSNDIIVVNNRVWASPTYVNATVHNAGTRIRINMDQQLTLVSSPTNLTFSGNFGGARSASFVGVTTNYIEYAIGGNPVYKGEALSSFSQIAAARVRTLGAPAGQGENAAFTPGNFTIASSDAGAADPPAPVVVTATVPVGGTQLAIIWSRAATRLSGSATLRPTYSDVGNQFLGTLASGNGTTTWVFNLSSNPIRISDIVELDIPAGWAEDSATGVDVAAITGFDVTNNSTQPYVKPAFVPVGSVINTDGQSAKLVFDRRVIIGSNFYDAIKILAKDITSGTVRVFVPSPGTAVLATTTVTEDSVSFDLTGAGTIFGNNIGGAGAPNDGDEARVHSNSLAGAVISYLSNTAGEPVGVDPIGAPTTVNDFANSIPLGNNSTAVEPGATVTPVYSEAEIYESSNEQFIRIRFDVKIQNNSVLPVLVSALAGPIALVFHAVQTGAIDGDEIVYRMTANTVKRAADGEIATLTITAGIVVSDATGTQNALTGPYTDGTNDFDNNSTIAQPVEEPQPPVAQQVIIGIDGRKVGIYYNEEINANAGEVIITSLLTDTKVADLTDVASQNTLLTLSMPSTTVPIFRGERVEVDLPLGLVIGQATGQLSQEQSLVAKNNSLIAKPRAPVIDSVTLNDPGTLVLITYDVPVIAGENPEGYTISDKSGRNALTIASIASNVVTANVAGIDYETEVVDLYLNRDFVREARYGVTESDAVVKLSVDVSARTSAAPDLPSNSSGLSSEAL